ncbi:MAG: class I adenylate-forming enzyme family protein [Thermoplasmataceae archaeon]
MLLLIDMVNMAAYIDRSVMEHPDNTAIEDTGRSVSYWEFSQLAESLSSYLRDNGVKRKDRIGILLPMSIDYLVSFYATWKIGAVAVPINNRFSVEDISFVVRDADLRYLFVSQSDVERLGSILEKTGSPRTVVQGKDDVENSFTKIYENKSPGTEMKESWATDEDEAMVMYTSGTTGKPKGVVQTHRNNSSSVHMVMDAWKLKSTDVLLNNVPLFHVGGLQCGTFPALFSGGKIVLLPRWNAWEWIDLSIKRKATWSGLVSTMVVDMVNTLKARKDLTRNEFSYRFIFFGGSPTPAPIISYFNEFFQVSLREIYGLTEATGLVVSYREGQDWKPGSMGSIMKQVGRFRIVDPGSTSSNGKLRDSEEGILLLQGNTITSGYLNRPDLNDERFIDGWFNTRDIARMDSYDFLYYLGRADDMIISGGENIYPQEVESLISAHPGVKEVAVIGTPHERWIEAVTAIVVPKDDSLTPEEVIKFCEKSISLASYKRPKQVIIAREIPKTGSGKINKAALKDQYGKKK